MYNIIVIITNLKFLQLSNHYNNMKGDAMMSVVQLMTDKGVKPSALRLQIYDYLDRHRCHPTVDEIYVGLSENFPTLSKTTVYNTVNLLAENAIIKAISIEGFRTRYDANTSFHGHFFCKECQTVYDIWNLPCPDNPGEEFEVADTEVFYTGRCKICVKNKK